jgi:hypothetical protein
MDTKYGDETKTDKDKPVDHQPLTHDPQQSVRGIARFISDHPAACVAGALTLGFLVARLIRKRA